MAVMVFSIVFGSMLYRVAGGSIHIEDSIVLYPHYSGAMDKFRKIQTYHREWVRFSL